MIKENICTTVHNCHGCCCNDVMIIMSGKDFKIWSNVESPPEWLSPENLQLVGDLMDIAQTEGTFYTEAAPDRFIVAVVGNCPHLDAKTSNCLIYENRPGGCRKRAIGSELCNTKRLESGLQPIYLEEST